jgi:phosphoribosylformimino-5-aminoimidazole carboxamide ribotide isomerase
MPLTLYPAIDLKDGVCVRLQKGEMDSATIYNKDPAAQAASFADQGCAWVHIVDLNGAFAGRSENGAAVEKIIAAVASRGIKLQLGGGLRDMAGIETWLEAGITRVILGSVAVKNPKLVHEACKAFPGRIVAGIDARDGFVAVEGWAETSTLAATELGQRMAAAGVCAIVYTDVARDGMKAGINIPATIALADAAQIPLIASGGIGSAQDLRAVAEAAHNLAGRGIIEGVIAGRALYDGSVTIADALAAVR